MVSALVTNAWLGRSIVHSLGNGESALCLFLPHSLQSSVVPSVRVHQLTTDYSLQESFKDLHPVRLNPLSFQQLGIVRLKVFGAKLGP